MIFRILTISVLLTNVYMAVSYAETATIPSQNTPVASIQPKATPWEAIGLMIANGNTMEVVATANYKRQLIVLSGIAAPARGQAYYKEARDALKELAYGRKLTIIPIKSGRKGFEIVKIQIDGVDVNAEMVKKGWAWVHKFYDDNPELVALEATARQTKIGLWQDENPVPIAPWEFRKQQRAARQQQDQESPKDSAVQKPSSTAVQPIVVR